jgi:hypothetical protein
VTGYTMSTHCRILGQAVFGSRSLANAHVQRRALAARPLEREVRRRVVRSGDIGNNLVRRHG